MGPESRHGHNVHLPAERRTIPWEMSMAATHLHLDEDLLTEAAAALGTTTERETVTDALRQVVRVRRERRRRALADLQEIAASGGSHLDRLGELDR
ncbi:type II toxin-antitoxin system VapB family antitoxin [Solwaraspora sp. WMMD937]|uniref:type II toxin-antitoxin system VapB family antitoxin n=1 Tax=Solwaraspora sp. WMMD937 TaxID=3016090 RepID=UPI002499F3AA|nr:type II toxin-antitoxin system VapB family antitoxin [Solwaraspora sp. WMMD937]WFE19863.1 type II toxin-antitoxin system VapB family antitoxin [Solwaraspora sp. WMMD937]